MITSYDCRLNGTLLSSLDSTICILDIREEAPELRVKTAALQAGQRILQRSRDKLTIHIDFAIHETTLSRRSAVMQAIRNWAEKGGVLGTSDRLGLQLQVVCTGVPGLAAGDMTQTLTLSFTSAFCPYWEDATVTSASSDSTVTMTIPGNAPDTPVSAVVINRGTANMTTLTLHCSSTRLVFEGISLRPGGMFNLLYTDGLLTASIMGANVLHCRTAASDDELLAPCGRTATPYATGDQPLQVTFSVRGRYL